MICGALKTLRLKAEGCDKKVSNTQSIGRVWNFKE
ncbi:MAG: hypothetical protein SCARUB_03535 [Candidatus Scalindua rubra]|uniref:Uncharacterized protein n=1 Tax=Candidatus Scalindua rubra TaxID=1872076 RepID=A0A1E3X6R2_9BACT|nr:MAG: hypothetical protein SCARUB_03535 [Candidatus Scalindua rubra]